MPRPRSLLPIARRTLGICALLFTGASASFGQFANHFFEKPGMSGRPVQRPDGKLWVAYAQLLDQHNVINLFDVPRLISTAVLGSNGQHVAGSDRLVEIANRFTYGFFAMAAQPDNKLLLGIETGEFFRFNADGSRDLSFNPKVSQVVGAVVVQPDGKTIVVPEMVRLNPDGSKDPSFSASLSGVLSGFAGLQSNGKILVSIDSSPYLKRLNSDGSIDPTFAANLKSVVIAGVVLPNDAILLRLFELDPNGVPVYSVIRLRPDGTADPSFHPDSRLDDWYAVQSDGKVLAGFRDLATRTYFLGRMNLDGSLDPSYQTYPIVLPGDNSTPVTGVFVQADGSILAEITPPNEPQQFLRFSSSGVLDQSSKRLFTIPAAVTRIAAQSDTKVLASGDFNFVDGSNTGPLIRLDRNGNLDAAFHPPFFPALPGGIDVALQSNDAILFSFTTGQQYPQLRLAPTGTLDPDFLRQNLGPRFEVRSDDKIVTMDYSNVVRRLLSDGTVDSNFSATPVAFGGNASNLNADFAIQGDGKIVIAGSGRTFQTLHSSPVKAGVVRLNADGGIDSSFNPPAFPGAARFNCVALQPDGKILLGGRFDRNDGSGLGNLIRLNSDGSVDQTFVAGPDYTVSAIMVEPSGAILIGGGFSNVNGQPAARFARLLPNGQLDPSFRLDTGGGAIYALGRLADGRVVAGGDFGVVASPALAPARVRNLSSRMFVDTGDNALVGGLIITGTGAKKLLIRAIGPSLGAAGIAGSLSDPNVELRDANGGLLASNDDWQTSTNKQAIIDTTIPPKDPNEAAIVITVPANGSTYTAIVRPARATAGIGMVEVYDLDPDGSSSKLANLSSRGNVLTGDKAMIGGFIVAGPSGAGPARVMVRALGPSVPLNGSLQDPTLELHQASSTLATNDDWKQPHQLQIEETLIPPNDSRESAIARWTAPGGYTAIVRGKAGSSGIGLLEIYDITQ